MKNVKQLLAVLACSAFFLGGCAMIDSDDINKRVESALKSDAELGQFPLKAKTEYGHVTVSGTVNNDWQKFKAGQVVEKVDGVKTVKNSVKVSE